MNIHYEPKSGKTLIVNIVIQGDTVAASAYCASFYIESTLYNTTYILVMVPAVGLRWKYT